MTDNRWKKITRLFTQALRLEESERQAWLEQACGEDQELFEEVNSLLRAHSSPGFLDQSIEGLRAQAISQMKENQEKGKQIGPFILQKQIGAGGMGVVWHARDTHLERDVAIKFPPPAWSLNNQTKQRFLHEARAAASLDHPNVCTIYESGETEDGTLYLAMAYYEGKTLRQHLTEKGALEADEVLDIAIQTARGLSAAHIQGLVHRDIKPANLMITPGGTVKILDFGIAKAGDAGLTITGQRPGTAAYMAPEHARGNDVNEKADLWSLGVVMYEMLTGQRPFKSEHESALVYSIVNDEPAPITGLQSNVPIELEEIIKKCLEKDTSGRYQHVDELISDLQMVENKISSVKHRIETIHEKRVTDTLKEEGELKNGNTKKRSLFRVPAIYIAIAAFAVITGLASYLIFFDSGTPEYADRVLVVPFENRTGDSSLNPVGRTAADWITEGILQSGVVDAVQTTTTLQLLGEDDLAGGELANRSRLVDLAGHTNAGIVVSGSFIQIGGDLRFETQIIDAERDEVIYTLDPVRGSLENPMNVVNELQQNILGVLSIHVYPGFDLQYFETPPIYEAYVEYMDGLTFFHRDFEKTIKHLQRALEIDPDFLQAILFKAWANRIMGQYAEADSLFDVVDAERERLSPYNEYYLGFSMLVMAGDRQAAVETARQWNSIAPQDQLSSYLLGSHALGINWPQKTVEIFSEFELSDRFIEEAPGGLPWFGMFSRAFHRLGKHDKELETAREGLQYFPENLFFKAREVEALAAMGEIEKVHNTIEESKTIDVPTQGSPGIVMLTAAYELRAHGNKEESLEIAEQAVEWYKSNEPENKGALANALYRAERWEEAYAIYEELSRQTPDNVVFQGALGVLAAMMGNDEEARQVEETLRTVDQQYLWGEHTYYRARINALLGNREKAVSLIEESLNQGRRFRIGIHRDLAFEPLQDYPLFQELLEPDR